jgi:phage shock protein PspC (stress-responsive transcriptional regulator)
MSDATDTTTIDEAPPRRLVRVDEGRWLGGVAAGLGRYFDINPLVYRIAFAVLALAGGTGVLLYLAAWLVIPGEHDDESVAVEALRGHRERPWLLVGLGLIAFGTLFALSEAHFWPGTGNLWLAAILVGGALVWWHVSQRERPALSAPAPVAKASATAVAPPRSPRPPKKPSLFAPVVGALLAVAGLFGLLAVLDIYDVDVAVILAVAVTGVGAAIAFGALTQRRVGGLVLVGILLLGCFAVAAVLPVSVSAGIGEKVERPTAVSDVAPNYELGIGRLDLDLSGVPFPADTTSVDASVGMGELVITVPEDVVLRIDAHVGAGDLDLLGEHHSGVDVDRTLTVLGLTATSHVLDLEADVGFGHIEVRRG